MTGLEITSATTIPSVLRHWAGAEPTRVALATSDKTVSFGELSKRVDVASAHLARIGVAPGAIVSLHFHGRDWIDFAVSYLAVASVGAVAMPLDIDRDDAEEIVATAGASHSIKGRGVEVGDALEFVELEEMPSPQRRQTTGLVRPTDPVDIVCTSGTTRRPVPFMFTHRSWIGPPRSVGPTAFKGTVLHSHIPLSTSGGLHGVLVDHLIRGVSSVAVCELSRELEVERFFDALCQFQPRELVITPDFARGLSEEELVGRQDGDLSSVRYIKVMGGPLDPTVGRRIQGLFPRARILSVYGLTEGGAATLVAVFRPDRPRCLGRPLRDVDTRVVHSATGEDAPVGVEGELWIRRRGFDLPSPLLRDNNRKPDWARSGDIVIRQVDGTIELDARLEDYIPTPGGVRVANHEVERHIQLISGVRDVCAVGMSMAGLDTVEEIAVAVVADHRATHPELLREIGCLPLQVRPTYAVLLDRLPMNAFGKIIRPRVKAAIRQSGVPVPPGDIVE